MPFLKDEVVRWWSSPDNKKLSNLSDEEFEKLLLDKWSHATQQKNETRKGLFSDAISLLQVYGCIQKKKIIVSINLSCKQNVINVNLAKKFQVPPKQMEHTQVNNEEVHVYKDSKISMDKYVLHSEFYASDMANVDVVLGYPQMESTGTININVQKKFLKLWYKKKKIILQDISINKQVESKEAEVENVIGGMIRIIHSFVFILSTFQTPKRVHHQD